MKLGTRAALEQIQRKTVNVEIPELDTSLRLREMSGTDRDRFEVSVFTEKEGKRVVNPMYLRARLVALCLVDEAGQRLYADDEIEMLSNAVPAGILGKLFDAAQALNGIAGTSVETAEKNSASVTPGGSTSA